MKNEEAAMNAAQPQPSLAILGNARIYGDQARSIVFCLLSLLTRVDKECAGSLLVAFIEGGEHSNGDET